METLGTILEWTSFGGSMLCSWLYGQRGKRGPICGLFVSVSFIAFGVTAGVPAAIASNFIFFGIHARNLRKAMTDSMQHQKDRAYLSLIKAQSTVWGDGGDCVKVSDFRTLIDMSHGSADRAGWWNDLETGKRLTINFPQKINLIRSEYAEAMEADRKDLRDDKLPHHHGTATEIGDALHRLFDLAGAIEKEFGLDMDGILNEELAVWYRRGLATSPCNEEEDDLDFNSRLDLCYNSLSWFSHSLREGIDGLALGRAICFPIYHTLMLAAIMEENVGIAYVDKWEFNETRPDHKIENRKSGHGKKY